ncbi:antibiotic biosynthesis monooxygenase [Bacterioplanes sanyensis]|uniref:Antibiotic biosynthesis monooxygenase n=1 Tax=Bacterioplanes sanyensis TaxID=1249553 RepID=A0A222FMM4_9GAMM|nr:antibiotic biosynthesis monooxygenase [Bacterioplanes sanyensis]ASP40285.1 antibiotic biosynthesis monooxygenase [Bacterioplanes sanyensis]
MIKVIIERFIADGMESTYDAAIKDTLRAMLEAQGYVSGATYKDATDSSHRVIITNWQHRESWDLWFKSEERRNAIASIQPILQQEEKITVLTA